jgi:SAM-dependent methyltransferase
MKAHDQGLERPDCALCGPGSRQRLLHDFAPFAVVACEGCGLAFLSPRPSQEAALALYQDPAYFGSDLAGQGYDEYLEVRANWVRTFERRLRQIRRHQPPGRALDVGCGPGFFLDAAEAAGYEAHGIDPSAPAVELARRRHGERVTLGVLESAAFPPGGFDLVAASDAFEHVYAPLRFLEAAHRLLQGDGLLAITTPDTGSLLARLSRRRWVSFKIPEHVYYWSRPTIRRALAPSFDVLEISSAGQYATVGFLLRRLLRLGPRPAGALRGMIALLNRVSVYANNGSLTVIARRRESPAPGGPRSDSGRTP